MDLYTPVAEILGFAAFLSTTYGTGDTLVDSGIVAGVVLLTLVLLQAMQAAGAGWTDRAREEELLGSISDLLNEMSLQISELRSSVIHELERYRAEVGSIRQDLGDLQRVSSLVGRTETTRRTTQLRSNFDLIGAPPRRDGNPNFR